MLLQVVANRANMLAGFTVLYCIATSGSININYRYIHIGIIMQIRKYNAIMIPLCTISKIYFLRHSVAEQSFLCLLCRSGSTVNSSYNEPREEIEKLSLYREFVILKIFKIQNFGFRVSVASIKQGQTKERQYFILKHTETLLVVILLTISLPSSWYKRQDCNTCRAL